jgi:DNA invertase Pin-like site-specific DNA recombinase
LAEFQKTTFIKERQRAGIEVAKAKGVPLYFEKVSTGQRIMHSMRRSSSGIADCLAIKNAESW